MTMALNWSEPNRLTCCDYCGLKTRPVLDIGGYEGGDFTCAACLAELLRTAGYEVVAPKPPKPESGGGAP